MERIFGDDLIAVRRMKDCLEDYNLLAKWLSDPSVCEYYEGKSKPYDLKKVMLKFGPRTTGEEEIIPCIIEYDKTPIGYIQYYVIMPVELEESGVSKVFNIDKYHLLYGIDIFIGETDFWNKGIGTEAMKMMIKYIFTKMRADIIFISPQTWNKRAIRCYEKSGFTPITIIKDAELHDDELKDCLIMFSIPKDETLCVL